MKQPIITEIYENEIFVFGSNSTGFHGEGSAGFAMRGKRAVRNAPEYIPWRQDEIFLKAKNSPIGSTDRIGKYAIYGQPSGLQRGRHGASWGIVTIKHPGRKWHRSISRREIYFQLTDLWQFANQNPSKLILMTPVGCGYSGWSRSEMDEVLKFLIKKHGLPSNILHTKKLYAEVNINET